ncbi:MAG: TIGR02594 family protein [Nitratireductor sp.]|nr:TIGR02594 family protein [Nitratireductor sp.]
MKTRKPSRLAQGALAGLLTAVLFFGGSDFTTDTAVANPARLAAIKRVEGLHERKNRKQIQAMVGVNPASTPWCGAAAAYAVRKAGGKPPAGHNKAISWRNWGTAVSLKNARKGDIVLFRFKRGYHVAVYNGVAGKGRINACGGNMSNQFKCSNYRASSVVAVRR